MRILHVLPALDGGGIERFIWGYYSNMDCSKFYFDFVKIESEEGILEAPLRELGSQIFSVPPMRKDHAGYCKRLEEIMRNNQYDAIHCHGGNRALEALRIAKKCGIPIRIAHAHTSNNPESFIQKHIRCFTRELTKGYSTHLFGCGQQAARWMWGVRTVKSGKVHIVNNAICAEPFIFSAEKRIALRKKENLENRFVIGHVGRLSEAKNHLFLLDVFAEVVRIKQNAVLLLVGQGELEEEIRARVASLGLQDYVRMLGVRKDVPELLNTMDLFVLPSHYEGLPVTMVEVQANGLPALISDQVTDEIKLCENVEYLPLDKEKWIRAITERTFERIANGYEIICKAGYDVKTAAAALEKMYELMFWKIVSEE